ncbi:MAG: XRE family transcriptional regulator [Bacteroidaceae bacterium]|nr:XRE family transcriptional regulator [Bacteroidaceae bacterium]
MSTEISVGAKIRSVRESKNVGLDELSQKCGLPVEQLAALEDGAPLPGIGPLMKIARALGVRLGTFLDDSSQNGPVVCKSAERKPVIRFSNNSENKNSAKLLYQSLSAGKESKSMDPFIIDILPDSTKDYVPSSHEGEEFIFVLSGKVEIVYGKSSYILEKGDSIYYDSVVKHHVHGVDDQPAQILAVIFTPY